MTTVPLLLIGLLLRASVDASDCEQKQSDVERAICNDFDLRTIDAVIASEYPEVVARAISKKRVKEDHITWLKKRNACGGEKSCIEKALLARIRQLRHYDLRNANGIDCQQANSSAELAICKHRELRQLDWEMTSAYWEVRARADAVERLKEEQRAWLKRREACGGVRACLRKSMRARINELERYPLLSCPSAPRQVGPFLVDKTWKGDLFSLDGDLCFLKIVDAPTGPTVATAVDEANAFLESNSMQERMQWYADFDGCIREVSSDLVFADDRFLTAQSTYYRGICGVNPQAGNDYRSWSTKTGRALELADLFGSEFGFDQVLEVLKSYPPTSEQATHCHLEPDRDHGFCSDGAVVGVAVLQRDVFRFTLDCRFPHAVASCSGPYDVPVAFLSPRMSEEGRLLLE